MTLAELKAQLETTGYRVAYHHFDESDAPTMPFICYVENSSNNFIADDQVYQRFREFDIQLFTKKKDETAESKVETALSSFVWSKDCEFYEDEICYRTIYNIQIRS